MATQTANRPLDMDKLHALLGQAVGDMGAALHAALIVIGDKLNLYRTMGAGEKFTPAELARRTGTAERYVREWLNASAASNYVEYDATSGTYYMTPEQSFALAQDDSAVHLPGFYHMVASCMKDEEKLTETFRTGKGFGWHEHEEGLFHGCERFFRPGYLANLTTNWIPALDGVEAKLKSGARVADVGCGHGSSTLLMAQTYPESEFFGFDYHDASIETPARRRGTPASKTACTSTSPRRSHSRAGTTISSPASTACTTWAIRPEPRGTFTTLWPDGTWMIVEPTAGDDVAANLNPVGRIYYSASTVICVPASLSQEVGAGLGAQAGQKKIAEAVTAGGFKRFRRATETPVQHGLRGAALGTPRGSI